MCKKITEEQRDERRKKRSAFLTRMVDEFKKVGFISTFVFCVTVVAWCMVLYTISLVSSVFTIIPSVATALQIISVTAFGIIGTAFAFYCNATSKEKKSLNDNGLVKTAGGAIQKIISAVVPTVSGTTKTESEDEDSDEKAEE